MRISKMNRLHPAIEKKKDALYTILRSKVDQLALDLKGSERDTSEVIDDFENDILELIDEALWPDNRNTFTLNAGEDYELIVPCFIN